MFRNYLKITWRSIQRNKVFSFINIAGLSIGIAVCILISLYIQKEVSYDKHWKDHERIVRINWEESKNGITDPYGVTAFGMAPALKETFPEVEAAVRMQQNEKSTVSYEGKYFNELGLFSVDTNFFDVFNFELLYGDPGTCLKEPHAVVISEDMSKRFFGFANPIGKLLKFPKKLCKVTGVLKNNGLPVHFKANAFLVIDYNDKQVKAQADNWLWISTYTYVKLKDVASLETFDSKLNHWSKKILEPALAKENVEYTIALNHAPVSDIHFDAIHMDGFFDKTNIEHLYMFGLVAFFILVIACFNYMNLSTARATKRAKEVGMRKVVGASRRQLAGQFLGESLILSGIALLLGMGLLFLFVPLLNSVTEKNIDLSVTFGNLNFWLTTLTIIVFISLVGGSYPALYLSRFQPAKVLKGNLSVSKHGAGSEKFTLRQLLVTTQFSISLIVIVASVVIRAQLKHMKDKDLGLDKEQVLVLNLPELDSSGIGKLSTFRSEILNDTRIRKFCTTHQVFSSGNLLFNVRYKGENSQASININSGDYDYIDVLNIKMAQGRNFSKDHPDDQINFIVNEAAARFLNLHDPLNAELSLEDGVFGKIIGVTKDYNYKSAHTRIEPLVLVLNAYNNTVGRYAFVKLSPEKIAGSVERIGAIWKSMFPGNPYDYFFLDEEFNTQYHRENTLLSLFTFFACLTILISVLGLFGLASFVAEQRTKEIGIRKIIGASVSRIIYLISKDFLVLVLLAIVIGSPVAYFLTHKWLQNFAYRMNLDFLIFVLPGFLILIVAFLTIVSLALRTATANPIKSLRTE